MNVIKAIKNKQNNITVPLLDNKESGQYVDNAFDEMGPFGTVTTNSLTTGQTMPGFKQPTAALFRERLLNKSTISQDALKINMNQPQMTIGELSLTEAYQFSRNTTGPLGKCQGLTPEMKAEIGINGGMLSALRVTEFVNVCQDFIDDGLLSGEILTMVSRLIAEQFNSNLDERIMDDLNLTATSITGDDVLSLVQAAIIDYELNGDIMDAVVYVSSDIFVQLAGQKDVSTAAPVTAGQPYSEFLINGVIRVKRAKALPANTILISEVGNIIAGMYQTPQIIMNYVTDETLVGYRVVSRISFGSAILNNFRTKLYTKAASP